MDVEPFRDDQLFPFTTGHPSENQKQRILKFRDTDIIVTLSERKSEFFFVVVESLQRSNWKGLEKHHASCSRKVKHLSSLVEHRVLLSHISIARSTIGLH